MDVKCDGATEIPGRIGSGNIDLEIEIFEIRNLQVNGTLLSVIPGVGYRIVAGREVPG